MILNNSISNIFALIAITIVVIMVLFVVKRLLPFIFARFKIKTTQYKQWLYISEVLIIIIGIVLYSSFSLSQNIIVSITLLLILLIAIYYLSQFFFKDYTAGLIIKASKEYRIGDQISVDDITGRIERFTTTQLKIKSIEGKNIYIPYSILFSKAKLIERESEKINAHTFSIGLEIKDSLDNDIVKLKNHIQQLPWIHPSSDTLLELLNEDKKSFTLNITVYAFDKKYYRRIENSVKDFISQNQ